MDSKTLVSKLQTGFSVRHGIIKRILVEGPDTYDFLNRLSTVQFSKATSNQSIPGAFLNEKSEVISLFQAWCKSQEQETVELFSTDVSTTLEYLNRMHFAENLKLTIVDDLNWIEQRGSIQPKPNQIEIPLDNWGMSGVLRGGTSEVEPNAQFEDVEFLKMAKSIYRFTENVQGQKILDVNLERYLNRQKGCYPGQEVVEKTITYGKPSKVLILFSFKSNATALKLEMLTKTTHRSLIFENKQVGQIVSLHNLDDFSFGLGIVNRQQGGEGTVLSIKDLNETLRIEGNIDGLFGRQANVEC